MRFKFNSTSTIIIVLALVLIGGVFLAASKTDDTKSQTYSDTDTERPKLSISEKSFTFDRIQLSDTKEKEISLKNEGSKSLVLSQPKTSCDCTFIRFEKDGQVSHDFSMHDEMSWQLEIEPGAEAKAKIIYKPAIMPVKGKVERAAFFSTNDPDQSKVVISFDAWVE